jgi:amino-acid N-acetyltransferase
MDTRRATQQDLERIRALLEESGLPALPSNIPLSNVIVALEGAETVGGIALEVRARSGLLRSAIVSPDHRRKRVGASLVQSIIARAHELGLRDLYLLTEDASEFFAAVGFAPIDRSEVPGEIRATSEYKEQCPESAAVMRLPLATRW